MTSRSVSGVVELQYGWVDVRWGLCLPAVSLSYRFHWHLPWLVLTCMPHFFFNPSHISWNTCTPVTNLCMCIYIRRRQENDKKKVCVCIYIYTGAGHIIRISSKSWFISLIPFKKWNLYNVYIHSTQTDIFQVFISFNFDDYNWQLWKPQIQYLRKLEYCEKVQYWRHLVPHSNQLINSKHLQRPLNGLSV